MGSPITHLNRFICVGMSLIYAYGSRPVAAVPRSGRSHARAGYPNAPERP